MRTLAFALYLVFIVSWFLHVGSRIPVLGDLRVDLILVLVIAGLVAASNGEGKSVHVDAGTGKILTLLAVYVVVTLPFVEWPGSVLWFGIPAFVKAIVFYLFTSQLVTSERRLRYFLLVFVVCQTIRVLEPVYLHVTQGYWGSFASMANWERMDRLSGAPSDVVNPNGLAFVILTVIPFLHYLGPLSLAGWAAYFALVPACLYALSLTGSRSGMLGLAMVVGAIWYKSRHKVLVVMCVVLAVALAAPSLSEDLRDRYRSIFSANTRNAATVQGRLSGTQADLRVAMRRPLFGHGLGTSREANANFGAEALPSHNLYTEVAQELGFVGLGIFLALMIAIANNVRRAAAGFGKSGAENELFVRLTASIQVLLAMNLLFSFASYGLTSYEWYFLAGLASAVRSLSKGSIGQLDQELGDGRGLIATTAADSPP